MKNTGTNLKNSEKKKKNDVPLHEGRSEKAAEVAFILSFFKIVDIKVDFPDPCRPLTTKIDLCDV